MQHHIGRKHSPVRWKLFVTEWLYIDNHQQGKPTNPYQQVDKSTGTYLNVSRCVHYTFLLLMHTYFFQSSVCRQSLTTVGLNIWIGLSRLYSSVIILSCYYGNNKILYHRSLRWSPSNENFQTINSGKFELLKKIPEYLEIIGFDWYHLWFHLINILPMLIKHNILL